MEPDRCSMPTSQFTHTHAHTRGYSVMHLSVVYFQASAQREIEESMQVFSELVRSIQKTQAELVLVIEEKQRQTERWAQGLISELEQEIAELKRRNADLEYVARTDHIHFLKVKEALFQSSVSGMGETFEILLCSVFKVMGVFQIYLHCFYFRSLW